MIGNYTGQKGELNFESDIVSELLSVGWEEVIKNPTHADLEENLRKIINENNVEKLGFDTLLTDGEFNQIIDQINTKCTTPVAANVFLNGKQVVVKSEIERQNYPVNSDIYLYIFDPVEIAGGKSRYQIVEQPIFETSKNYNDRRGDILLLINGLPVIQIELKASGISYNEGVNQIQKYMNEGVYKGLFSLIQVFFVITPEDAVYFANAYPKINPAFIFHWGDGKNNPIYNWQKLIRGNDSILSIPEAHQLVGYYVCASISKNANGCIEDQKKINEGTLMVARSYQVHAIQNILKRIKSHTWGTHDQLGGYLWGTTGCGKTYMSYKTGQLAIDKNYADKIVFVVDRVELSNQSYNEYNAFARNGEPVKESKNTRALYKMLLNDKDKLIITSIQKLSRINEETKEYVDAKDIKKINEKRIVFIIDEAHRSHFGEMHERVKNTFSNALFIGFTGTPIFGENDKNGATSETVFGPCLFVYSITSAIRDKNVLGFDQKMVRTFNDNDLRDAIACKKANVKSMDDAKNAGGEKWKIYQKYFNLPMVKIEESLPSAQYNTPEHRKAVVDDILSNWDVLSNAGGGTRFHAIFATNSIPEAVEYYRLLKATGLKVTALFDPNLNENSDYVIEKGKALVEIVDDYNNMFGTGSIINRDADSSLVTFKTDITNRLAHKGPYSHITEDNILDIVIVVDELLTGFDSKYINTLYLDKVPKTDNLIQAISRTNRVLTFDEKPWGIFRYYRKPYTMEQNIKEALRLYCEGGESSGAIVAGIDENAKLANELFDEIKIIFDRSGIADFISLPKLAADCQKFRQLFKDLKNTIHGMKLQGMKWESDDDEYVQKLKVCDKWIDGKQRLYNILNVRYEDIAKGRDQQQSISEGSVAFDLQANLSEVEKDRIDADYLEEHFKQIVPVLLSDLDELEKNKKIDEFSAQLGVLSAEQQKFAYIIIDDIKGGKLDADGKTLRELIAEYQTDAENQKIAEFANQYGLDETLLHKIYHTGENADIEIGKLRDTCDIDKVKAAFSCNNELQAKAKLVKKIKEFIGSQQ